MNVRLFACMLLVSMLVMGCGNRSAEDRRMKDETRGEVIRAPFSSDSAFVYLADQVNFGPRTAGSQAHTNCAAYIVETLRRFGATVTLQPGEMLDYSGRNQRLLNIIAHFGPTDVPSILLGAHYDSRPWTDEEPDYDNRRYCVPGANDGASGVAVLLEVARQLSLRETCPPVTMVFFDLEDMGTPTFYTGQHREETWCLGSQYFARHLDRAYSFGVILDMVGAADACFAHEFYSTQYANDYVEYIWHRAHDLGHAKYFRNAPSHPITDDHLPLCRAGIPTVDIVHYNPASATFPSTWHTRQDDVEHIDRATLQAVGEVVMAIL